MIECPMDYSLAFQNQVIKRLITKSKSPPSVKTCKSKLEFASGVLNLISNNINEETALFASEIVKLLQIYLKNVTFVALDKLILKICSKIFLPDLFKQIQNEDDIEILAGICYVKYKKLGLIDDRIYNIIDLLTGDLKAKIENLFGPVLHLRNIQIQDCDPDCKNSSFSRSNFYKCLHNGDAGVFCKFYNDFSIWNNFDGFLVKSVFKEKSLNDLFILSIKDLKQDRIKSAKNKFLELLNNENINQKVIIYNLLAYVHLVSLEFQESIFYIDLCINNTLDFDLEFSLNCKLLIERYANIQSLTPYTILLFPDNIDKSEYINHFDNKLLLQQVLGPDIRRISLFSKRFYDAGEINDFFKDLQQQMTNFSILYIFTHQECLYIHDIVLNDTIKILWEYYLDEFNLIMAENTKILKAQTTTSEDKRVWWSTRIKLDNRLKSLVLNMRSEISLKLKSKILLVLDGHSINFPFDVVFDRPSIRALSHNIFNSLNTNQISNIFYLLDPINNLKSTRETFSAFFSQKIPENLVNRIAGIEGRPLKSLDCCKLAKSDLFIYIGHGTGKKYFELYDDTPKSIFLLGCSSCRLIATQNFKPNGYLLKHLKKSRMVVGNLWDVTDKDLDILSIAFIQDIMNNINLIESLHKNRNICKLKYLNSAALVIYGVFESVEIK